MDAELKSALSTLSVELEGKNKTEVKSVMDAFEVKYSGIVEGAVASVQEEFEAKLKEVQAHADTLDIKLNESKAQIKEKSITLKSLIQDNFDNIKEVRKGKEVTMDTKAVADMTLAASLTGDQPRDYSAVVAGVPRQMVNFADLVQAVTINGGTYTFPKETGSEGAIATQTEGSAKSQIDYDFTMVDVNTDFIAGYATYSKKMANNLPFLESYLPQAMTRDYWKQENSAFNTALIAGATASAQIITGKNMIEMLMNEVATLEGLNFSPNGIALSPADFYSILKTEKSTGAGYGLPGVVTFENGQLRINGIPLFKVNWLAANKYHVADWSQVKKVVTEGLNVAFSTEDGDNFKKNNISARVEAQVGLAVERGDACIYGDFTAV
tara:strand:- start:1743 stop:2888 length:1146 start_codon:yes stop_codon:yes gene_type:complete